LEPRNSLFLYNFRNVPNANVKLSSGENLKHQKKLWRSSLLFPDAEAGKMYDVRKVIKCLQPKCIDNNAIKIQNHAQGLNNTDHIKRWLNAVKPA
jgi:hypothetical protein